MKPLIIILSILMCIQAYGQDSLSLDDCKKLVLENHEKVKIAMNQIKSREAQARAVERDFYPTISVFGGYKYLAEPVSLLLEGEEYYGPENLYEFNATLSQNVYAGGMTRLQTENARYQEHIATNTLNLTTDQLLYQTELYYWKAAWAEESNTIAMRYKTLLDTLVRVIGDKVETGLVAKNDLLMTEVKQNEAELMIYKTRMQHAVSIMELNRIIGFETGTPIDIVSSAIYENFTVPAMLSLDEVYEVRPEMLIQQDKINISENNIGLTRSKYAPRVDLNLQPVWGAPNTDLLNPDPIFNAALMASVSMPIFNWGKKQHEVNAQQFGFESSKLELEDLRKQISLELTTSYYRLQEAASRIGLTEASLAKAQENYLLIEDRYLEGLSPIIELLDAQFSWLQAYNAYLDSRMNYFIDLSQYNRVIGNL